MCGEQLARTSVLSTEQRKVLRSLCRCRTAELGGHLDVCERCGVERPAYNSCRDRHCPKCQALAQHRWLQARRKHILPVHHFHVVFTLPAELRPLLLANARTLYGLLLQTAPQSVLQLAADPKRLGAQLGLTAVLHTWRRDLGYHPHLHCVVTGGGLDEQGKWRATRPGFLLPVRVLGKLVRGKFLDGLRRLHARGELVLPAGLPDAHAFEKLLDKLYQKSWCVYCKRPFGGADAVFQYLGRYTHRIGISNARILQLSERTVVFRTRLQRTATLPPEVFLARLLQHVLPHGFVRIRHYGLLASGNVHGALAKAKSLLEISRPQTTPPTASTAAAPARDEPPLYERLYRELTGIDLRVCAHCGGAMNSHPLPAVPPTADVRERAPP
jgi:hypothetical protein